MESAVILAGGKSTRMGRNKALLDFGGETLIERVFRILRGAFEEVIVSANDTQAYEFLGARVVCDVFANAGSLAGIHSGLVHARGQHCFVVACDMPFVNVELVRYLHGFTNEFDVVIPQSRYGEHSRTGLEPLHSFYSRRCIPHIEEQLRSNNLRIIDFFDHVSVRRVTIDEVRACDPEELSYFNINTPEKYERARARLLGQRKK